MPIRVALQHRTTYRYDRPVHLGPQTVRLRPAAHARTPVSAYSLKIEPADAFLNWQQDPQGNFLARLVAPKPVRQFSVQVDLIAEMVAVNPFDYFLEPEAEQFPFAYAPDLARELRPYLETAPVGPHFEAWLLGVPRDVCGTTNFLSDLVGRVRKAVNYVIRMEPGVQEPEVTLAKASGSCRDSAWLLVQILRRLGIAARFVSGYLIQLAPDDRAEGEPAHDFTDLHAWAEAYLPGAGWVGLDATSGLFAAEGHIPLAATPEPGSAAPISGAIGECQTEFDHVMSVTRLPSEPRVSMPYTEEQWARIDALGQRVDADLRANDVRLTTGGEPTFVAAGDADAAEWTIAAVGPTKQKFANKLFLRLRDRFAPGALLHYGQGKWYPGESLPRWAFSCYWRSDGQPIWQNPALTADDGRDYGFGPAHAVQFARALAVRLGLEPKYCRPAYEDPWHFLNKEGELPTNVDPLDNRLDDAESRERIRRVFGRGLNTPVGCVLPLAKVEGRWQSGHWKLRTQHIVLVPGDSAIGLRLPLASLPWSPAEQQWTPQPLDPSAWRPALPTFQGDRREPGPTPAKKAALPGDAVVRTALCVEPRGGRLYVFMPPAETCEAYLELVAALEATAGELGMPILLEGYQPPTDARLQVLRVTPDPGVLEINVHPSATWDELRERTETLYAEAKACGLVAETFLLDGRHAGTGGGNHVVLGAATPLDSPFLRRPDLLRSLLAYWLNHPSLSYLFAGLFVGPTSQAPRLDEARTDSVYELEIAFGTLPAHGDCPPWLVDRVFRHLLTDVSGNTHRAEFCIDKLYSPDSATGRLGLVELRAFEMPPHARMSLAQMLLVRALVAWLWREPYTVTPVAWGTRLHDRFMLPHYASHDLLEVLSDLRRAGFAFEDAWFAPHQEFRFPLLGRAELMGGQFELRQAIEPWHVLGEEPGGGGTVRYVDSSVERVQVKLQGLDRERYVLACNGRRVPLQATGTHGESVAGVRFRAWQPPTCLHPTIAPHVPLVFDLIDTWAGRSVGGCTYHAGHPGGRTYETRPVNALEAEGRRASRFQTFGHTPGAMAVPAEERNAWFPMTLDLRRGR